MKREVRTALVGFLATLLAISGCGKGPEEEKQPRTNDEPCRQLLGEQGIEWLESHTRDIDLKLNSSDDNLADKRKFIQGQIQDWRPGDLTSFGSGTACGAGEIPKKDPEKSFQLHFNASNLPFDSDFTKRNQSGLKSVNVTASPDVKLVYGPHPIDEDVTVYQVYIKCGVEGAAEGQLNEVPLKGNLEDTLTGDPSPRTHLKHLLHSAKVMVDGFGCTNKPQIPTTVPASVKD